MKWIAGLNHQSRFFPAGFSSFIEIGAAEYAQKRTPRQSFFPTSHYGVSFLFNWPTSGKSALLLGASS